MPANPTNQRPNDHFESCRSFSVDFTARLNCSIITQISYQEYVGAAIIYFTKDVQLYNYILVQ